MAEIWLFFFKAQGRNIISQCPLHKIRAIYLLLGQPVLSVFNPIDVGSLTIVVTDTEAPGTLG